MMAVVGKLVAVGKMDVHSEAYNRAELVKGTHRLTNYFFTIIARTHPHPPPIAPPAPRAAQAT